MLYIIYLMYFLQFNRYFAAVFLILVLSGIACSFKKSDSEKDFIGITKSKGSSFTAAGKDSGSNLDVLSNKDAFDKIKVIDLISDISFRYHRDGWTLLTSDAQINTRKLKAGGVKLIFAAIGNIEDKRTGIDDEIALLKSLIDKTGGALKLSSALSDALSEKKAVAVLVLAEGADELLNADDSRLMDLKQKGLAAVGLVGASSNKLCDADVDFLKNGGLTKAGISFVQRLRKLGIIIDLTHASQKGFYDVLVDQGAIAMVSHSAVRALREHKRNLDDVQIISLKRYGGLMGLVFNPDFLAVGDKKATIDDVVRHIKYIKRLGALSALAIGSDFDGIIPPKGLKDISMIQVLRSKLKQNGFLNNEIKDLFYNNAKKFFQNVIAREGTHEIGTHEILRPLEVDCDTVIGESKGGAASACNRQVLGDGPTILSSSRIKFRIHSKRAPHYIELFGISNTPWQIEAQNLNGDIVLRRGLRLDSGGHGKIRLPSGKNVIRLFLSPTRPSVLHEAVIWGN